MLRPASVWALLLSTACTPTAPDAPFGVAPANTVGQAVSPDEDVLSGQFVLKLGPSIGDLSDGDSLLAAMPALARAGASDVRRALPGQRFSQPAASATRAHATWTFASDLDLGALRDSLADDPNVAWVEPLIRVRAATIPNDPYYGYQWHMSTLGVTSVHDQALGGGTIVAVIDSGVSPGPDGIKNMLPGRDFFDDDDDASDSDADRHSGGSHGTHVAGTIAQATNNNTGVIGVAPETQILPVRVLGLDSSGAITGTSLQVANGITWAVDNGADVINLSLGSNSYSRLIEEACEYAWSSGVLVVAAAGNDGFADTVSYPAALDSVVAVAATDLVGERVAYSNAGAEIDLAAPGGDLSADLDGDGYSDGVLQETRANGSWNYFFFQGTSMATPHVAGAAALVLSSQPDLTVAQLKSALVESAFDVHEDGRDNETGHGVLDVSGAMTMARTSPPESPAEMTLDQVRVRPMGEGRRLITWQTLEAADTVLAFPNGNVRRDPTLVTAHHAVAMGKAGKTLTYSVSSTDASGRTATEELAITF